MEVQNRNDAPSPKSDGSNGQNVANHFFVLDRYVERLA